MRASGPTSPGRTASSGPGTGRPLLRRGRTGRRPREVLDEAGTLVDAVVTLAERIDPPTAFVPHYSDHGRAAGMQDGAPPDSGLERMPFVLVCGEPVFEPLGGRDRLLDAPAYETLSLETSAIPCREHPNSLVAGTGQADALFDSLFESAD